MQFAFPFHRLAKYTLIFSCLFAISSSLAAQKSETPPREQIGTCLGKPVYRDQIRTESISERNMDLNQYFFGPVFDRYYAEHQSILEPTPQEIKAFITDMHKNPKIRDMDLGNMFQTRGQIDWVKTQLKAPELSKADRQKLEQELRELQAELAMPGSSDARMLIIVWKLDRHLYKKYGGGRIRLLKMGIETIDATHKWLEDLEKQGYFKITDPELRTALYFYWTPANDNDFVTEDPRIIRESIFEPEWLKEMNADEPLTAKKP
ncbi:MAG: hypothetical protein KDA70_10730 [Planctomycetaceae bacterium]|nr:hypothetical protein [Planctomycetaceae bacterium]